jgi:AraC-like DNA-binding protein
MRLRFTLFSLLFIISIAQAVFFILLLLIGNKLNTLAGKILLLILCLFLLTNLDYLLISSNGYQVFPYLFGISNGLILLMGPLLLFYARALVNQNSRLNVRNLLHFLPYLLFLAFSFPVFLLRYKQKIQFIEYFTRGNLALRTVDYVIFSIQILILALYIVFTTLFVLKNGSFLREIKIDQDRKLLQRWLRILISALSGYLILVLFLLFYVVSIRKFSLQANYTYTLASSLIIFILVGFTLLHPKIALGEIFKKHKKQILNGDTTEMIQKLVYLMEKEKVFTQSEIKINEVAKMIHINPYLLSRLINEKFGRNFPDFINYYRVEEFKQRLIDPQSARLSMLGLAYDVGFNSKTSFNTIFKKFTGVTPSEYKGKTSRNINSNQ